MALKEFMKKTKIIRAWFAGLLIVILVGIFNRGLNFLSFEYVFDVALQCIFPVLVCYVIVGMLKIKGLRKTWLSYLLFFSISITSMLGLTVALTGSHASSDNKIIYGLSFYTATIAFLIIKRRVDNKSFLVASNPLLLITGPVGTLFEANFHRGFKVRWKYYFPYFVFGLFLYQGIAANLPATFFFNK